MWQIYILPSNEIHGQEILTRTVKLTKNADPDKYGDSSYCIGFDARSQFSFSNYISS